MTAERMNTERVDAAHSLAVMLALAGRAMRADDTRIGVRARAHVEKDPNRVRSGHNHAMVLDRSIAAGKLVVAADAADWPQGRYHIAPRTLQPGEPPTIDRAVSFQALRAKAGASRLWRPSKPDEAYPPIETEFWQSGAANREEGKGARRLYPSQVASVRTIGAVLDICGTDLASGRSLPRTPAYLGVTMDYNATRSGRFVAPGSISYARVVPALDRAKTEFTLKFGHQPHDTDPTHNWMEAQLITSQRLPRAEESVAPDVCTTTYTVAQDPDMGTVHCIRKLSLRGEATHHTSEATYQMSNGLNCITDLARVAVGDYRLRVS